MPVVVTFLFRPRGVSRESRMARLAIASALISAVLGMKISIELCFGFIF